MQAQQLYNEVRKLRQQLEQSNEEKEDMREELREMTQMYLFTKQERDKYKMQMDNVKKDIESMDRIIKDNVERALRTKEKQHMDLNIRIKEQQEKIQQLEDHKKCYSNTITYLESQIKQLKEELETEKDRNYDLLEKLKGKENINSNGGLYDEKARLKQLMYDDEQIAKYNGKDDEFLDDTHIGNIRESVLRPGDQGSREVRTTEGGYEEDSYDDTTTNRLKEDTNATMFGLNANNGPIKMNQIQIDMSKNASSSGKKFGKKMKTPAKVTPFDY